MSKLKVNEVQANTTSQVTVKSNLVTEAGITNSGGTVSLGTQTGFQSTGIDDNASATKLTVQDATPQVDVNGTINATGLTVAGVAVPLGPGVVARGKFTCDVLMSSSGVVVSISSITKVGTGYNFSSVNSPSTGVVRVTFTSTDFDGTEATNMVQANQTFTGTSTGLLGIQSRQISETDTTMDITFIGLNNTGGSGNITLSTEVDFVIFA